MSQTLDKLTTIKKSTLQQLIQNNKDLTQKVVEQQLKIEGKNTANKELLESAELIRVLQRAMKGLPAEDDVFLGLIDPENIKERTRLSSMEVYSHSAMRVIAAKWKEFDLFGELADIEDHYLISGDNPDGGLGRKEALLLQQARTNIDGNMILNMPNTNGGTAETTQPQAAAPKKKGNIFSRLLHR